jgi:hypothetical protein
VSEKFAFIDAEKAQYPIVKMCTWLDVSTSGFYEWRDRPRPPPSDGPELVREIMRVRGLVPCQPRPWRPTTQPGAGAESIPDLFCETSHVLGCQAACC